MLKHLHLLLNEIGGESPNAFLVKLTSEIGPETFVLNCREGIDCILCLMEQSIGSFVDLSSKILIFLKLNGIARRDKGKAQAIAVFVHSVALVSIFATSFDFGEDIRTFQVVLIEAESSSQLVLEDKEGVQDAYHLL